MDDELELTDAVAVTDGEAVVVTVADAVFDKV